MAFGCGGDGAFDAVAEFLPFADCSFFGGDGAAGHALEPGLHVLGEQLVVTIHGGGSGPLVVDHQVGAEATVRLLL